MNLIDLTRVNGAVSLIGILLLIHPVIVSQDYTHMILKFADFVTA